MSDPAARPALEPQKRKPRNFMEGHALRALLAEPSWTVTMYCVFNDYSDEATEELREFAAIYRPVCRMS